MTKKKKILWIDDDDNWHNWANWFFGDRYDLEFSGGYEEARSRLSDASAFDLVILNVYLYSAIPNDLLGITLLEFLGELDYAPPVVVITANDKVWVEDRLRNLHPYRIIHKNQTFNPLDIRKCVDEILSNEGNESSEKKMHTSAVMAVVVDQKVIGNCFIAIDECSRDLVITCAHVLVKFQIEEGSVVSLVSSGSGTGGIKATVCWSRHPESDPKDWSAREDVAILKPLDQIPSEIIRLKLERSPDDSPKDGSFFGYCEQPRCRGDWFRKYFFSRSCHRGLHSNETPGTRINPTRAQWITRSNEGRKNLGHGSSCQG